MARLWPSFYWALAEPVNVLLGGKTEDKPRASRTARLRCALLCTRGSDPERTLPTASALTLMCAGLLVAFRTDSVQCEHSDVCTL